jgi:hypothetical protein
VGCALIVGERGSLAMRAPPGWFKLSLEGGVLVEQVGHLLLQGDELVQQLGDGVQEGLDAESEKFEHRGHPGRSDHRGPPLARGPLINYRNGPRLPAPLKELFLSSYTNETPISIFGQILGAYNKTKRT